MPFGSKFTESSATQTEKVESPFLTLRAGQDVTIRILDEDVTVFWKYWYPVNLGDRREGRPVIVAFDNPIKKLMDQLGKDSKEYRYPSKRGWVNVLDRTEYTEGQPANTVKILELGKDLIQGLQALDGRVRSRQDYKPLRVTQFDIVLVTTGERTDKVTIPTQGYDDSPLPDEFARLPRYDLVKMSQPMPNDAVQHLIDGANYMEIRKQLGWIGSYPMVEAPF